ncbi:CPBP family intramembrane metalloprotease [Arachnia propionica]|uniref:CPBP family intramembrane metalloprotease n=1 Tax=Arachnia propionica TaxID=1750 RepID=A0A3P1T312_9ACTN|nr:CPBP family intramembrane glutamic endopeptidase [Arachnia propionica]RRD03917.1 CPBP family intramembrane metalloprotease [Arachnia propionica]
MRGQWVPRTGVRHPLVLYGQVPWRLLIGTIVALLLALLLPGVVSLLVLGLATTFRQPDDVPDYLRDALAYHFPEGVLATHLGLASMILIALVLMRYLHHASWRWTASVQPGMRWRYLVICSLMAVVVLNIILWVGPEARSLAWQEAQPQWYVYLAIILVTSPLQAAAEEVFFRGYLQQSVGSATGHAWIGVLAASLVFALMHGPQNQALFLHRLGFGLIAGALVVVTGGLEAAIAIHVVNNLMAFGYALISGGVATAAAVTAISWSASALALGSFALCALLAWWIGRRMNLADLTP